MGIAPSCKLEFEELVLLPPEATLPLDITKFISGWKHGVPQSLMKFSALSKQLHRQLDRLPTNETDVPEDWVSQSSKWAQEVFEILDHMHKIAEKLSTTKPEDLRGNFHPIEEYTSDISSTMDEFVDIIRPLQTARTQNKALISKTLNDIRRIYMFQGFIAKR